MSEYLYTPEGKDPGLWRTAHKIASFKRHMATYLIINIFLWLLWVFTDYRTYNSGLPWPLWATLGWGIGLFFNYLGAYKTNYSVEKEYDKLKQNQSKL